MGQASLRQRVQGELVFDYGSLRNEMRLERGSNLQLGNRSASSRVRGREAAAHDEVDGSRSLAEIARSRSFSPLARATDPRQTNAERRELARLVADQKGAFDKIHALIKRTVAMRVWHEGVEGPEIAGESIAHSRDHDKAHSGTPRGGIRPHAGSADVYRDLRRKPQRQPRVDVHIKGASELQPIFRMDRPPGFFKPNTYCVCGIPGRPTEAVHTTEVAESWDDVFQLAPKWDECLHVHLASKEKLSFTVYEVYDANVGRDPNNDVPLGTATWHNDPANDHFSGQLQLWQGMEVNPPHAYRGGGKHSAGVITVTLNRANEGDGLSDSENEEDEDKHDTYDMRRVSLKAMQADAHKPATVDEGTAEARGFSKRRRPALAFQGSGLSSRGLRGWSKGSSPRDATRRQSSGGNPNQWAKLRNAVGGAAALRARVRVADSAEVI